MEADLRSEHVIEVLECLGPQLGERAVLYPCTDPLVLLVSEHRDRLRPWYHVVLPDHDVVRTLTEKASFAAHAQRCGLPVPLTFLLTTRPRLSAPRAR
jgi:D-aspartate ligase